ncbi:MAG TPA: hypothetical protein VKR56_02330 [Candidatus Cybelea sp.]|nr:hypothetical protein [Candidatus Cybelea sp.]
MLLWQCEACLAALQRGRAESLAARRRYDVRGTAVFIDHQDTFSEFQSALTFAANASKMLWPRFLRTSERVPAMRRGRRLRYILGIKKRNPALYSVPTIRNNFEHLDTRLDAWAERTKVGAIGIHALASDKVLQGERGDRFTRYDQARDSFLMLEDKIDLKKLETSITQLWRVCAVRFHDIRRYLEQLESPQESK